jgi:hypothetical protein
MPSKNIYFHVIFTDHGIPSRLICFKANNPRNVAYYIGPGEEMVYDNPLIPIELDPFFVDKLVEYVEAYSYLISAAANVLHN